MGVAIESVNVEETGRKIYNLQGIEVSGKFENLPSGIYIVGGCKVKK